VTITYNESLNLYTGFDISMYVYFTFEYVN
jgi:hypothetical protein